MSFQYPFGQSLIPVVQKDRSPKKVFILGVYASAVHAKWRDQYGTVLVQALAVASEPYIFWRGEGAGKIINQIEIPREAGMLEPAARHFNGPSGKVLDELYLAPLELTRDEAWLCDLLPGSRINRNQRKAIKKHYHPLLDEMDLPECTIPHFSRTELRRQENRHQEILDEIEESQAEMIVLLGDLPIKHWLAQYTSHKRLSNFGEMPEEYGRVHDVEISGNQYQVLPLVHPRQAGKLGRSSKKWTDLHAHWVESQPIHNG